MPSVDPTASATMSSLPRLAVAGLAVALAATTVTRASHAQPPGTASPDQEAARRAIRVAETIRRAGAAEAERAAAYARAAAILDSAETSFGQSDLTTFARGLAALYRAEASLTDADTIRAPGDRCVAARRARTFADSVALHFGGADHSPSRTLQALYRRAWELRTAAPARVAAACR